MSKLAEVLCWFVGPILLGLLVFVPFAPLTLIKIIMIAAVLFAIASFFPQTTKHGLSAWRGVGILWACLIIYGYVAGAGSLRITSEREAIASELEALRDADTSEYLVLLREHRSDLTWLAELQLLDPEGFEAEISQRDHVNLNQVSQERERLDRLVAEREQRQAEELAAQLAVARQDLWRHACRAATRYIEQEIQLFIRAGIRVQSCQPDMVRDQGSSVFAVTGYYYSSNRTDQVLRQMLEMMPSNWTAQVSCTCTLEACSAETCRVLRASP